MHIVRETLDDALLELYPVLLAIQEGVTATRGDSDFTELVGVLIELTKPRARLSRSETRGKLFSSLGELLWYLSRDNKLEFIERYVSEYKKESEDGATVHGGYGPRLFSQRGADQIANVVALLRDRPTTRRAVIQIFDAEDINTHHKEVPCTTTLQFFVRKERLDMITTMRSNDAYLGLPHDAFCFTMLQELVARSVGVELGTYKHFAGSLHLYREHHPLALDFVNERFQAQIEMPPMPAGDPWASVSAVLEAEGKIRAGLATDANAMHLDPYWCDLIRILQIHFAKRGKASIDALAAAMSFAHFKPYILSRTRVAGVK
jgi:thymidylate synthase